MIELSVITLCCNFNVLVWKLSTAFSHKSIITTVTSLLQLLKHEALWCVLHRHQQYILSLVVDYKKYELDRVSLRFFTFEKWDIGTQSIGTRP